MTPPPDQVWELVLQRIDQIHDSLHKLREEMHGQITSLATGQASLLQWKKSQEPQQERNTAAIAAIKEVTDVNTGALKMLKLLGGVILGLIALAEFILHARGP